MALTAHSVQCPHALHCMRALTASPCAAACACVWHRYGQTIMDNISMPNVTMDSIPSERLSGLGVNFPARSAVPAARRYKVESRYAGALQPVS
jgi:hypothetical protein